MPKSARLWVADAEKRDFRKSTWKEQPAEIGKDSVIGMVEMPTAGYRVFYGEMNFEVAGLTYYLSTQVRVLEKK